MLSQTQYATGSKYSRLLIKPMHIKQQIQNPSNIFAIDRNQTLQDVHDLQRQTKSLSQYSICGDKQFRLNFISSKRSQANLNNDLTQTKTSIGILQPKQNPYLDRTLQKSLPTNNFSQTIYLDKDQRQNFITRLHRTQKNSMDRQRRTMQKFKQTQQSWQKIQAHLKYRLPKVQTVTFSSTKDLYVHQNPQKLQIINDMIPLYWKSSLRNNDKKLKSHLKGHSFKQQLAEEMLQTIKGTKKLENSIPKIVLQRSQRQTFDERQISGKGKIRLKSKKIQKQQGNETMRQFHKSLYHRLNQTMKQGKEGQSVKNFKAKSKRSSSINSNFQPQSPTSQTKCTEPLDPTQNLTQKQKRNLNFCQKLQNLDRIDNQVYLKQFQKKRKWIHQGYQF